MCLRTDGGITQPRGRVWFGSFFTELLLRHETPVSVCVGGVGHLVVRRGNDTLLNK